MAKPSSELYLIYFHIFFMGILLTTIIFNYSRYIFRKDKESLFFSIYGSSLFIYFVLSSANFPGLDFLNFGNPRHHNLLRSNQINLTFILYFYFASVFLDGKNRYPKLNNIITAVIDINCILWVVGTFFVFIIPDAEITIIFQRTVFGIIMVMAILATIGLAKNWSYLERFFLIGTAALILSGLYGLINPTLKLLGEQPLRLASYSGVMFILCILVQLFTYGVAIGFKTKREKNKILSLEKFWIRELETNKMLQEKLHASMLRYQEQLELEVKERSDEIIRRNNELQEATMKRTVEEYKRMAVESELKALRTQINPHFLFNCMNILSSFVIRDLKDEALDFILKFSKLMRLVLENSRYHEVLIEKDIEALKLYIQLEAIRYDFSFEYDIQIAPDLIEEYRIPPMLLQPYVENAIKHGLSNKESGKRRLIINLFLEGNHIICEISDNGVGRQKAALLKAQSTEKQHESIGMKVTESRITLLEELSHGKASVDIRDLEGDESGTVIRISLPVHQ